VAVPLTPTLPRLEFATPKGPHTYRRATVRYSSSCYQYRPQESNYNLYGRQLRSLAADVSSGVSRMSQAKALLLPVQGFSSGTKSSGTGFRDPLAHGQVLNIPEVGMKLV
jgi:hypothetical protein